MIKIFVEQTTRPNEKNVFDKKTGKFLNTVHDPLTYPYPYGYILDTKAPDGENLDCYIISDREFNVGDVVECNPIAMAEWFEDGEADHKILAVPLGEEQEMNDEIRDRIENFANDFMAIRSDKKYNSGEYYGKNEAESLISNSKIKT